MILSKTYKTEIGEANLEDVLNYLFNIPNSMRDKKTRKPFPRVFIHYLLYTDFSTIDMTGKKRGREELEKCISKSVFNNNVIDTLFIDESLNRKEIDILFEVTFPKMITESNRNVGSYLSKSINQKKSDKIQGAVSNLFQFVDYNKLTNHLSDLLEFKAIENKKIDILFYMAEDDYDYKIFKNHCTSYAQKLSYCVMCSLIEETKLYHYFGKTFNVEEQSGARAAGAYYNIGALIYTDPDGIYDYFGDIGRTGDINSYIKKIENNTNHNLRELSDNESSILCLQKAFKLVDVEYCNHHLDYYENNPDKFYKLDITNAYYSFVSTDGKWFMRTSADKIRISTGHLYRIFFCSDRTFGFKVWGYTFILNDEKNYIKPLLISRINIKSVDII